MRFVAALLVAAAVFPAGAQTPDPAAKPAAPAPRILNLKNLSCEDFLGLAEGERNPIVWYIAGDYREAGRLGNNFDLDLATQAMPAVWQDCKKRPLANLRYVVNEFFKTRMAEKGKSAAKK